MEHIILLKIIANAKLPYKGNLIKVDYLPSYQQYVYNSAKSDVDRINKDISQFNWEGPSINLTANEYDNFSNSTWHFFQISYEIWRQPAMTRIFFSSVNK